MTDRSILNPSSSRRATAAQIAIWASLLFLILLSLLHFLRADLEPSWHFISEYELGDHGWVMRSAFGFLAIANLLLLISINDVFAGVSGWIARVLFGSGAFGLMLGGLFAPDPMNTVPAEASYSGMIHNIGGALGLPALVGTIMISLRLWSHPRWLSCRKTILLASGILLTAFLISFIGISLAVGNSKGVFGPETLVGWPNRIGVVGGCLWIMIIARQVPRRSK